MLGTKAKESETITIPAKIAKRLSLKDGTIVEARVEKGKLLILGEKDKTAKIMQYAGIWEKENVDKVFKEIRTGWSKWQKSVSA